MRLSSGVLTALDIYGHPIGVNNRGSSVYKTNLGTIVTLLTYILIMINTVDLITKFRTKSNQLETYQQLEDSHEGVKANFTGQPLQIMIARS